VIATDDQRRWWFATHPEYSWSRKGKGTEEYEHNPQEAAHVSDPDESVPDMLERRATEHLSKKAFIRELMKGGHSRESAERKWAAWQLNESIARGVATAMTVQSAIMGARAIIAGTYRWLLSLGEVGAIMRTGGPGKWVEVARARQGLAHQSKMSGQPIVERGGKLYIREYEVNGVKFDDYRKGVLYEYRAPQGNLLKNREKEFRHWCEAGPGAQKEAIRQAKFAEGIPVVWRVGADQVHGFKQAVGNVPGIEIIP